MLDIAHHDFTLKNHLDADMENSKCVTCPTRLFQEPYSAKQQ
jgi:hypothetical protein